MTTGANPLNVRRFVDEAGNPIVPGQKLGEGGEGVVHLVDGDPVSVLKIWHPGRTPQDADAKISHLVRNPVTPGLGATWQITWPRHLVREGGVIAGYTMPILNPNESWEPIVKYYNLKAAEATEAEQGRELRIDDRVRMARNVALGFRAVHKAGYVIGDVNEKNIEVNRQNEIAMVDCDSYGFTDPATGRTFTNNMGRAEFQAPEAQGNFENRTQGHDRFGLAVIIFLLLTGYHPHTITGRRARDYNTHGARISEWLFPPAARNAIETTPEYRAAWNRLAVPQKELFLRCFDRTYAAQLRPTPVEWLAALQELPEERPSLRPRLRGDHAPQPQPSSQPTQPKPPSQPVPDPQASTGRPIARRAKLVAGVTGLLAAAPILFWLFTGGYDKLFQPAADAASGSATVSVAAVPVPTPTLTPTTPPTIAPVPTATALPTATPTPEPTVQSLPVSTPVVVVPSEQEVVVNAFAECNGQYSEWDRDHRAWAARSAVAEGRQTVADIRALVERYCDGVFPDLALPTKVDPVPADTPNPAPEGAP